MIEPQFTLRSTMLLGFIGYVFNLVIPGAVGGDLIKAAYLVRMHIKKTQAVASMVIDRILGLLGLFVAGGDRGDDAWSVATPEVRKLILAAWVATGLGFLVLAVIFTQAVTRLFPGLGSGHGTDARADHDRAPDDVGDLPAAARRGLRGPGPLGLRPRAERLAFYLMSKMLFPTGLTTTLAQHFLMVPLTLFTMVVPIPFGALGVSEEVGNQLGKLVGHPGGALAMLGFRVLMYACGLISAVRLPGQPSPGPQPHGRGPSPRGGHGGGVPAGNAA